jgi:hypothetical protein
MLGCRPFETLIAANCTQALTSELCRDDRRQPENTFKGTPEMTLILIGQTVRYVVSVQGAQPLPFLATTLSDNLVTTQQHDGERFKHQESV